MGKILKTTNFTHKNTQKSTKMFFEPIYLDIDMSGYQPVVRQSFKKPRFCEPGRNFCKPNSSKQTERTIYLNLPEYNSENIQVKINKEGRVLVSASKDKTVDTDRNGQRKTTVHMEHSFDLSEYLVKEDMLKFVKSQFDAGKLVFTFPEKPVGVKMQINFEKDEDMEVQSEEQTIEQNNSEVVKKMVDEIEKDVEEKEKDTVDFEIVKVVDADGNTDIDVE